MCGKGHRLGLVQPLRGSGLTVLDDPHPTATGTAAATFRVKSASARPDGARKPISSGRHDEQVRQDERVRQQSSRPRAADVADAGVVAGLLDAFNREFDTPTPGPDVLATRLERLLAGGHVVAVLAGEPAMAVALVTMRPNVW